MGKILAICISEVRGTKKNPLDHAVFKPEWGIEGDAHGGNWHRQVSLLSADKIKAFNEKNANVLPGDFGENLVVDGFDFRSLPVGTLLRCGDVLLEMTQVGKECHTHCAIYQRMNDCIMPREGVFARVLSPGVISVGDEMTIEQPSEKKPYRAAVITLSDRCSRGECEDKSGPVIVERLKQYGYVLVETRILCDDKKIITEHLCRICDQNQPDLIITTGGTGFSPRDNAPEATLAVADRLAPGIAEAIRAYSMTITPRAMLSRGVSVIRGRTLIINLPGSVKAVGESMDCFMDTLPHGLDVLCGQVNDCARGTL